MELRTTLGGRTNLHVWRTGQSYARQKGHVYLREWNNVLFSPHSRSATPDVLALDIRRPLPFSNRVFDAVYLLHIVEHLTPEEAERLVRGVWSILKPSGILRISTPDLEDICRAYLDRLEDFDGNPTPTNLLRYEWSVLELLDQIVRVHSGGMMCDFVRQGRYDRAYAALRYGDVFDEFVPPAGARPAEEGPARLTLRRMAQGVWRRLRPPTGTSPEPWQTGEVNKWMWDRFSLTLLLDACGFRQVTQKTFRTSDIPEWERFDLDRSTSGDHAIEPSLYMEARRPTSP